MFRWTKAESEQLGGGYQRLYDIELCVCVRTALI